MKSVTSKIMTEDQLRENGESRNQSLLTEGRQIFESRYAKKYPGLGEMFDNPEKERIAAQTVHMLENQREFLKRMDETTIVQKFGDIAPKILDIIRVAYPNQVAHELVDVQTMKSTHDLIYYIKPVYSQDRADKVEGDDLFESEQYASEETRDDAGTGTGSQDTFNGTATYVPVRPKTVKVYVNDVLVGQDVLGDGKITGSGMSTSTDSTIVYSGVNEGAYTLVFAASPAASAAIVISYNYDTEQSPDSIGGVDLVFTTFPVTARAHKLRMRWSVDASLVAASAVGIDVEDTLSIAAAQELKAQKDIAVVNDLIRAAGAVQAGLTFDFDFSSAGGGITEQMWAQGFRRTIAKAGSTILNAAKRGDVTWLVVGTDVEEMMTYLDAYVQEPNPIPIGIFRSGTYRGKPVFKNRFMSQDEFLSGFKGTLFGDSGYVLAEYLELYTTPTMTMDDFIGRKGMASFYDKKIITSDYYKRGKVDNIT